MESEQSHNDHTVSLLAYSYTLCGTKYRYAHSKVSLTSPTHLREHIKGRVVSLSGNDNDRKYFWVSEGEWWSGFKVKLMFLSSAYGVDVSENLTIDNALSKCIIYD